MKSKLLAQLQKVLPSRMRIPEEIELLYHWIEKNGLYVDTPQGSRMGFLSAEDSQTDEGRDGGTAINFLAEGVDPLKYWFGKENEEVKQCLCVFAQSGDDGSKCALWLTDDDEIKIVHMGSGSGSTLNCVLADNALDFLRLLAIGYDEICWDEAFDRQPDELEFKVTPNIEFQKWVKESFDVQIPKIALEIVKYPDSMDEQKPRDEFNKWCKKHIA